MMKWSNEGENRQDYWMVDVRTLNPAATSSLSNARIFATAQPSSFERSTFCAAAQGTSAAATKSAGENAMENIVKFAGKRLQPYGSTKVFTLYNSSARRKDSAARRRCVNERRCRQVSGASGVLGAMGAVAHVGGVRMGLGLSGLM